MICCVFVNNYVFLKNQRLNILTQKVIKCPSRVSFKTLKNKVTRQRWNNLIVLICKWNNNITRENARIVVAVSFIFIVRHRNINFFCLVNKINVKFKVVKLVFLQELSDFRFELVFVEVSCKTLRICNMQVDLQLGRIFAFICEGNRLNGLIWL